MRLGLMIAAGMMLAFPALAQTAPSGVGERPPVTPIKASKVILVGDSTTQTLSGWGGSFCAKHVTSFLHCVNMARGGRSTYSYRAEGSWDLALSEMKAPGFETVWVLIQFGHNDQPGKPGRSTDLASEFPENLRLYVREARAAGAVPVLLTPLTRRQFVGGRLENDLEPWSAAIRAVAKEMDVPLIDLNAKSVAAVQAMGPSLANRFAQMPPSREVAAAALTGTTIASSTGVAPVAAPAAQANAAVEPLGDPKLAFDYTHLGAEGADFFSAMVTAELAVQVPKMRRMLVQ
ncbi:rhamnogalacturonan acetylesterase [Sphingomonas sp. AOB5]|uniref:rhamnogalacturonan acetylesterase n=1 Tax=Sphingomonas sp. AOB5 TaxID=3034017 RepID=UPI0023F9B083|nr:rhamnogalacturonan acetylesterase [Sphingomonas sp. AOB5]MDF7777738.1 rhamnogalacturonan acetylesterase [Sphingomonas sp. AOB5]